MTSTRVYNGHAPPVNDEETAGLPGTEAGPVARGLEKTDDILTRDEVLHLSSVTIRQLHRRTSATRFKTQGGDRDRLAYVRALSQFLTVYSGFLRDAEIADLEKRIAVLEGEYE